MRSTINVGVVYFQQPDFIARGALQKDGTYKIGSASKKDGLPPGLYTVYISGANETNLDEKSSLKPVIDDKFSSPSTSGLTVEVTKKNRRFDFKVDRYIKPTKK